MTIYHDYHMARLRIARLEEALREAQYTLMWREKIAQQEHAASGAESPRWTSGTLCKQDKHDHGGYVVRLDDELRPYISELAGSALTPPASSPRPAADPCEASVPSQAREA